MSSRVSESKPDVSIVIPCWNVEKLLHRSLDTCLRQTHVGVEIIAVDDGSTDGTAQALHRYAEAHPGIVRVFSGPNLGLSAARNVGIFAARGEYIQFLDADDEIKEDRIARALEHARSLSAKTVSVAPGEMIGLDGRLVDRPCSHVCIDDPLEGFLTGRPVQIAAFFFRKADLVEVGGFNDGFCEDFDLYARLCARGYRFAFCQHVGFRIHKNNGGMSDTMRTRFTAHRPPAYRRLLETAARSGQWTEARSEVLSWRLFRDADVLLQRGEVELAMSNVRWAREVSSRGMSRFLAQKRRFWSPIFAVLGPGIGLRMMNVSRKWRRRRRTAT